MSKSKKAKGNATAGKVYLGAFVDPEMKRDLKQIAKTERRSLNAQVEFFLAWGVEHLKRTAKQVA